MNRRLVAAACIVLAGVVGSTFAALAQPAHGFSTPAIQPGDRWLYNATGAVPADPPYEYDVEWSVGKVAFQAGPAVDAIDGFAERHSARQLDELREYRFGDAEDPTLVPIRSWHALDGTDPVATARLLPGGGATATNTVIGPTGDITAAARRVTMEVAVGHGRVAPLCGHAHSAQGLRTFVESGLLVHGACAAGAWDGTNAPLLLRHSGHRTWNGRSVEAFAADGVEAWMDRGIPVPVFLRLGGAAFELAGYEAADMPAPYPFAVHGAPALSFVPRQPYGPDEAGVEHPFPMSAAFSAAAADEASGMGDFLARHPTAQVVAAAFQEEAEDTGTHREWTERWTFTVSDGTAAHGVQAQLVLLGPMGAPGVQPALAPPALPPPSPFPGATQVVHQPEAIAVDPVAGPWPSPGDLPAEMPAVASLLARWDAYKAEGRGVGQAWGFEPVCAADGCAGGHWRAWAGFDRVTWPFEACAGLACAYTKEIEASTLEVDGHGTTMLHREVTFHKEESLDLGLFASYSGTPPAAVPPADPLTVAGLPAPVTAIGALATLAALLVLAWPWLKAGGPLALFSRVAGDRVLDSPRRAAIAQLIEAEPGIHLRELARRTGQAEGALRHHLALLVDSGKVRAVRGPRYLCYFPMGPSAVDRNLAAAAPYLKSEVARRLLERCIAEPGLSGQRLAADLGVTGGAVTYHVQRLSAAGLLAQRRVGRELLVDATPLGRAAA